MDRSPGHDASQLRLIVPALRPQGRGPGGQSGKAGIVKSSIQIKRAYEAPSDTDGLRVFVDRLWPRGLSKDTFHYDLWCKDLAPSSALRTWFGHKPEQWDGFRRDYAVELKDEQAQARIGEVFAAAQGRRVTLVFGAKDTEHNQAVVLADVMNDYAKRHRIG